MNLSDNIDRLSFFNKIEKEFDVNQIKYKNCHVWPLIRIYVKDLIVSDDSKEFNMSGLETLKNLFGLYKSLPRLSPAVKKEQAKLDFGDKDVLMLSTPMIRTFMLDNKYVNRHIDPLFENITCSKFVIEKEFPSFSKRPTYNDTYSIENSLNEKVIFHRLMSYILMPKYQIKGIKKFRKYLKDSFGLYLDNYKLLEFLIEVEAARDVFFDLINKLRVKAIFFDFFYHRSAIGACWAAYDCKIRSIDLQHGNQINHSVYASWMAINKNGYEFLPSEFWVWNELDKKNINEWCVKSLVHKPLVVGNMMLEFYKKNRHLNKEIQEVTDQFSKTVLLTMADFTSQQLAALNEKVLPLIESKKNILFVFRAHPEFVKDCERYLINQGIMDLENVCFDDTKFNLFDWLEEVDLHITFVSSVIFEARLFNVPSIIIDPIGFKRYESIIDNKFYYYADTINELKDALSSEKIDKLENNSESKFDIKDYFKF